SNGIVLTNNHVIKGATTIKVVDTSTHHTYAATVLGYDVADDVAVLKLQGASHLKTVTLGDSSKARTGQLVTAVGNAGGTGRITTATGRITALRQTITASDDQGATEQLVGLIETNAGVQPGDSGGPLVDSSGRVLGMDTAGSNSFVVQGGSATTAYAIPINKALSIAKQIESGNSTIAHIGPTAFMGVSVEDVGNGQSGALIAGVVPGGPADQAGLAQGDIITALDGNPVDAATSLGGIVQHETPGASVEVDYLDQLGQQQTATITLGSGPPQ
ncbi:MAG TPA: trypsin-like peptidase domain-containing protein, partial [Gaiellaceae bacterium]|nr:trypsin-like peptidase domain-containing protein [Gaiellaceae bacterium]